MSEEINNQDEDGLGDGVETVDSGAESAFNMGDYDSASTETDLSPYAQYSYMLYALSVVKGRALPSIEDGQKPVQRRILYAMRELSNYHDGPFKKSARIVGDVIGKYHPHGDTSVYDAAVRMAQDFTMRYPLIEGQGNFGSRDGDTAAAMRYTEVRLSRFAEDILIKDIERNTVGFRENYDESLKEPVLMPARLPVMLLNGASGIAVGMATDIPPHNIQEVSDAVCAFLESQNKANEISDVDILSYIKGPDFAGGAHVISSQDEIMRAYMSGRGSLRVRARWKVEPLAKGQWQIVIYELPPSSFDGKEIGDRKVTGSARILAEIDEMLSPKMEKGKKALTVKQLGLKASAASMIDRAQDDSDEKNPIRIVIEPKSMKVSADELMALLMANTALEGNIKFNLVSIGRDGRPSQKGVPSILKEWCGFRMDFLERRLQYRLDEVLRRLHILGGRMIAFLNIEEVIRVIRNADEPKLELMAKFDLTEIQAEDILEIKLRQLARLEGIKIEREIDNLKNEKSDLERLLSNENERRSLLVEEIRSDTAKYADDRRTLIEEAKRITASSVDATIDEDVTIILSENGFIRMRPGHGIDGSALTWKAGDSARYLIETRTSNPVVFIDVNGRSYSLKCSEIPSGKGDGSPLSAMIDTGGAKIAHALSCGAETRVMISKSSSFGFICKVKDMVSKQKAGKSFATVIEGDEILQPVILEDETRFIGVTSNLKICIFPLSEVKELDGGKGVTLVGLSDGCTLEYVSAYKSKARIKVNLESGKPFEFEMNSETESKWLTKRTRKGEGFPIKVSKVIALEKND